MDALVNLENRSNGLYGINKVMNFEFPRQVQDRSPAAPQSNASCMNKAAERRGGRVVIMLLVLWILGAFDLTLTVISSEGLYTPNHTPLFVDANPIARLVLHEPYAVFTFKLGALAFGTAVLFICRRSVTAEIACWLLCGVYIILAALVWPSFLAGYREQMSPKTSYAFPAEFERPRRQAYRAVAADIDQQSQRQAVYQQARAAVTD